MVGDEMSMWKYLLSKLWLTVRHRSVKMSRCSFQSVGKGWLVNLSLPINRIAPNYTKEDAILFHERLQAIGRKTPFSLFLGRTRLRDSSTNSGSRKMADKSR